MIFRRIIWYVLALQLLTYTVPSEQSMKARLHGFRSFILHQNHPRCNQVDHREHQLTCELHDLSDVEAIGFPRSCADAFLCPDGSYNRACLPEVSDRVSYTCLCQSEVKPQVTSADYHWSEWQALSGSKIGIYRDLQDILEETPDVLAREYRYTYHRKHNILTLCLFNVGPSSKTALDQCLLFDWVTKHSMP